MGELTRTQRKKLRRQAREEQKKQGWSRRLTIRILVAAVPLLIASLTLLSFLPSFSISITPPLDPKDLFSTPFEVTYNSVIPVIPIEGVSFNCYFIDVKASGNREFTNADISNWSGYRPLMWPGDAATFRCPFSDVFRANGQPLDIQGADVQLFMRYRPYWVPWWAPAPAWMRRLFSVRFHYVTASQSDGKVRWVRQPSLSDADLDRINEITMKKMGQKP